MSGSPTVTHPHYTNEGLDKGIFDRLMVAVSKHLDKEFKAGRIKGDSYSKAYIASLEAAMANSTQYLLGILLLDERREELLKRIELTEEQARQLTYQTDSILPQELLKLKEETQLITSQRLQVEAQTNLIEAQILLTNAQEGKVRKEIEYLSAKIVTEQANTDGTIADIDSLVGRQIDLLRIQGLGFAGDLQAKWVKHYADYDITWQSVHEDESVVTLDVPNTQAQIQQVRETVNQMKANA